VLGGALLLGPAACASRGTKPPAAGEATDDGAAMGSWTAWRSLEPLVELAESHVDAATLAALREAQRLLASGKAAAADARLAREADGAGRHWIAAARGDLAALHFRTCIRGVAWRLEDDAGSPRAVDRAIDMDEGTALRPGDVSVEATLEALDAAVATSDATLVTQARIARARVAAFVQQCPANDEVRDMSGAVLEADLATLAAEGHLTPDLAYLWAGVQMNRFSGAAARPFLQQAKGGGFDHPSVDFLLAVIALEQRELAGAEALAASAASGFEALGDAQQIGQVALLQADIARARGDLPEARKRVRRALARNPDDPQAAIAMMTLIHAAEGEQAAVEWLARRIIELLGSGELTGEALEERGLRLEGLVLASSSEPPFVQQLARDAMLAAIDEEGDPLRQGLRYLYAAVFEARLAEYQLARGHALLAKDAFAGLTEPPPVDVEAFLDQLPPG
jgi:tetratricopeptide (TPR) repeat protein